MGWEFDLLYAIQNLHSPWLDDVMVFITSLADHGRVWVLLGLVLLMFSKTRCLGVSLLLSLFLGFVTGNQVLKHLIARQRPCWLRPEVALLVPSPRDYSFPSGHTLVSFEGAFSIWNENRRWGTAALAAAALIGFSRMYLFVHFPTDVLGGMVLGAANAWAARRLVGEAACFKKSLLGCEDEEEGDRGKNGGK